MIFPGIYQRDRKKTFRANKGLRKLNEDQRKSKLRPKEIKKD